MAQPTAHNITTRRTARYFTLGNTVNPQKVWVVLHGYAFLGSTFIKEFEAFAGDDTLIIAPEGLSRFYAKGLGGDAAASWMTREDRLADIADNVYYLERIYAEVIQPLGNVELNGLGFSQGAATLTRWAVFGQTVFNKLIFWAGDIPNDVDVEKFKAISAQSQVIVVYGTEDTLIPPGYTDKLKEMLTNWGIRFNAYTFDGKHELNQPLLAQLL